MYAFQIRQSPLQKSPLHAIPRNSVRLHFDCRLYGCLARFFIRNKFTNVAGCMRPPVSGFEKTYRWFLSHARRLLRNSARLELSFQLQDPQFLKSRPDYWRRFHLYLEGRAKI